MLGGNRIEWSRAKPKDKGPRVYGKSVQLQFQSARNTRKTSYTEHAFCHFRRRIAFSKRLSADARLATVRIYCDPNGFSRHWTTKMRWLFFLRFHVAIDELLKKFNTIRTDSRMLCALHSIQCVVLYRNPEPRCT